MFDISIMLFFICSLFGLIAGLLIGAAGIGGVILVPLLVYFAGIDIHTSIAASVASFFVSGLVGTITYSKRGVIQWLDFLAVGVGAVPGAGSKLMTHIYHTHKQKIQSFLFFFNLLV